ncbi:MAG: outer membrane beta-barrel protein [Bacteroidetes bacterium]|jgi:hypothetical protein|nr:outer membrane beta-barrel protein [Bacteroidota bacterium]
MSHSTSRPIRCGFSLLAAIILLLIYNPEAGAQEIQGSLNLGVGVPMADFSNQLDRVGFGIDFEGGYRFGNSPVMLGLEFGFMNFGRDEREEPFSTTIPDVRVEVENTYNMVKGDLFLRLIAPPSRVRPYADALVGFNYFFTETVIRERGNFAEEPIVSDTNFDDTTLNYGLGAGLQIRVYRDKNPTAREPDEVRPSSVFINLRSRYLFGQNAQYLQEGSIENINGEVSYDISESETDLLHIKVGVVVSF